MAWVALEEKVVWGHGAMTMAFEEEGASLRSGEEKGDEDDEGRLLNMERVER